VNECNSSLFLQLVDVYRLVEDQIDMPSVALEVLQGQSVKFCLLDLITMGTFLLARNIMYYLLFCADLPSVVRDFMLSWSDSILSDRRY
jgi:aarF domain-containing kinase